MRTYDAVGLAVADDMDTIADYIAEHGFTQFVYVNDDGRVCSLGAARRVELRTTYALVIHWMRNWLRQHGVRNCPDAIVEWNDAPGQTQESVVAGWRQAAADLRSNA